MVPKLGPLTLTALANGGLPPDQAAAFVAAHPPTPRQIEVLRAVDDWWRGHHYSPALMDAGRACGIRSPNGVRVVVGYLAAKGLVTWEPRRSRTLQLTPAGVACLEGRE